MKTIVLPITLAAGFAVLGAAAAGLPEPDNLVYGGITLDGIAVTAAQADVAVEARRSLNGPAVSRYRMGSDLRAGDSYALRLGVVSGTDSPPDDAFRIGDSLFIVVVDPAGVRAQAAYTVQHRGTVLRLDFTQTVRDSDGNGLPDAWEVRHFGAAAQNPAAINANGQTTLQNYIAGTDPNDPAGALRLTIALDGAQSIVSVPGRRPEGPGYEGLSRSYSFEASTSLEPGSWAAVPGAVNLVGANAPLSLIVPLTNPPSAFRLRVSLHGP